MNSFLIIKIFLYICELQPLHNLSVSIETKPDADYVCVRQSEKRCYLISKPVFDFILS